MQAITVSRVLSRTRIAQRALSISIGHVARPRMSIPHNVFLPLWDPTDCSECLSCVEGCQEHALRAFLVPDTTQFDETIPHGRALEKRRTKFVIQVAPHLCTSCNECVDRCRQQVPKGESCISMSNTDQITSRRQWDALVAVPKWDPSICIQCSKCIEVCPTGAFEEFVLDKEQASDAPAGFSQIPYFASKEKAYSHAVTGDCMSCGKCVAVCPPGCLELSSSEKHKAENFDRFDYAARVSKNCGLGKVVDVLGERKVVLESRKLAYIGRIGQYVVVSDTGDALEIEEISEDRIIVSGDGKSKFSMTSGDTLTILGPFGKKH